MEYRTLGQSDLKVSVIGFGAWGIGGKPFWQGVEENESINSIKRAVDLGINFFDTAPVYGFGYSETLLGKALEGVREKVIVATKCGLRWEREELGNITKSATRESIMEEIDLSLQRLKTDYIDLYQVHWPDVNTDVKETMGALTELQEKGKIRHIGVSNYTVPLMEESLKYGSLVSLQPMYNMVERDIEKEVVPYCVENNMGIIAYSPLASGVLTGKYDEKTKFNDWRGKGIIGHFTDDIYLSNIQKVKKLKKIAERLGKTMGELAINWVINQKCVSTAIVGIKRADQVTENLGAIGWNITPEDMEEIVKILNS